MYYQNGNYMQDLNYYNQNPNYQYNSYMNSNYQNNNMQMPMMQGTNQNLNAFYPAVHRIISPVVSQVLSSNNTSYITEDSLNSMVDSVYNIVEGDVNLHNQQNLSNESANCERNSSTSRSNSTTITETKTQNSLLKDLIKIMILNEIICKRQNCTNYMMNQNNMLNRMPNTNMNQQPMFI